MDLHHLLARRMVKVILQISAGWMLTGEAGDVQPAPVAGAAVGAKGGISREEQGR